MDNTTKSAPRNASGSLRTARTEKRVRASGRAKSASATATLRGCQIDVVEVDRAAQSRVQRESGEQHPGPVATPTANVSYFDFCWLHHSGRCAAAREAMIASAGRREILVVKPLNS